jgi:hypothetical protein
MPGQSQQAPGAASQAYPLSGLPLPIQTDPAPTPRYFGHNASEVGTIGVPRPDTMVDGFHEPSMFSCEHV